MSTKAKAFTLLAHKTDFLEGLLGMRPKQVRQALQFASIKELNLIIRLIRLICTGAIPIQKSHFSVLVKSKKLAFIKRKFEDDKEFRGLLAGDRKRKLTTLYNIQRLIPILIKQVFENE